MADDFDALVAGLLTTPPGDATPPADDKRDGNQPQDTSPQAGDDNTPDASDAGSDDADKGDEPPADQSADDGADGGEDQTEDSDSGDQPEPFYTVKLADGKSEQVTLKQALEGYQRQSDYTRKTQELAAHRQQVEAEQNAAREQRGRYEQILTELQRRLGPENGERSEDQWNELRGSNPEAYAREYTDFLRRQQQRGAIKAEQDRINEQKTQEGLKQLRDYVASQRTVLEKDMPDFFDPVKGPKIKEGIRKLGLETLGFSEQELDRTYDARVLKMAHMAMQWHNHVMAQQAAKGKLAKAPPMDARAPGAKQIATPKTKKAAADQAAMKRLEKSGSIEDALSLILTK